MSHNVQITTYKQDYVKKTLKEQECPTFKSKTTILLNYPTFLKLDDSDTQNFKENLDSYLNRFRLENEKIANIYFPQTIESEKVKKVIITGKYTEYQKNYCDPEKERELKEELLKKKVILPEDIHVPSTSYENAFRNPKEIYSGEVRSAPFKTTGTQIRDRILQVDLISEYMDIIGKSGEEIIKRRLLN